jgi:quercetin dioxygenase-like cupin family protein
MVPDSTTSIPAAPPTASRDESGRVARSNDAVITAIRAHHGQLAEQLRAHVDAAVNAARSGAYGGERDALVDWCRSELLPHASAEEQALYRPAANLEPTRLLIAAMIAEHRALERLVNDLAFASDSAQVSGQAVATQALFAVHLGKENDLLLPALDQAGVNLSAVLHGMHEILGGPSEDPKPATGGADRINVSPAGDPHSDMLTVGAAGAWSDWRSIVAPRDDGPDVAVLHESAELKVVLVALAAGQALPAHPGPAASFHILSGTGAVVIDGVAHPVSAGATVIAASGTRRSVRAASALVFLGNLGEPAAEEGPH